VINTGLRIERDYQELMQGVRPFYEGQGWPCFNYYATLSIAVRDFLVVQDKTALDKKRLRDPQMMSRAAVT